jgi:S-DNA-T family DNA segregation ATPase FtsK/SpoIIIE
MFSFDDKGIFYFAGEGKAPQIVYGYGFDLPASKAIVARARVMREHAGRITGYASAKTRTTPRRGGCSTTC